MGGAGPVVPFVVRRLQKPCPLTHTYHTEGPFFNGQRGRKACSLEDAVLSMLGTGSPLEMQPVPGSVVLVNHHWHIKFSRL